VLIFFASANVSSAKQQQQQQQQQVLSLAAMHDPLGLYTALGLTPQSSAGEVNTVCLQQLLTPSWHTWLLMLQRC
jgi:hypothetical protein